MRRCLFFSLLFGLLAAFAAGEAFADVPLPAVPEIVFVCTGNTCRSPMAEGIAKKLAAGKGLRCRVVSRGTRIDPNETVANLNAVLIMQSRGVRISEHRSLAMSAGDAKGASLILTMTESHKKGVLDLFPEAAPYTFTLIEYTTGKQGNISDPWGKDLAAYAATADQLESLIPIALKRFADAAAEGAR